MSPAKIAKSSRNVVNVGLTKLVSELIKLLDKSEARLGPVSPGVTNTQKKRLSKPRRGSDKIVSAIAPIVQQYGLDSATLHSGEMIARHTDAQTLLPLQQRLEKILKRVNDEVFAAESASWDMALQFYALLQRRGASDGDVANSIAPVASLFAYRHPSVLAAHPKKMQTRAKAKLAGAIAMASRHGITVHGPQSAASTPTSPAAFPPPTTQAPVAPTVAVGPPAPPVAAPVAAASPLATAPTSVVTNGASNGVTNGAANGVTNGGTNGPLALPRI